MLYDETILNKIGGKFIQKINQKVLVYVGVQFVVWLLFLVIQIVNFFVFKINYSDVLTWFFWNWFWSIIMLGISSLITVIFPNKNFRIKGDNFMIYPDNKGLLSQEQLLAVIKFNRKQNKKVMIILNLIFFFIIVLTLSMSKDWKTEWTLVLFLNIIILEFYLNFKPKTAEEIVQNYISEYELEVGKEI